MSDEIKKCSRCGSAVSPEALQGICPACLLAMNLSAPTEEFGPEGTEVVSKAVAGPSVEELSRLFPQLEILETLGRGGMGVVFKARHPKLDRMVALKVLLRRDGDPSTDKAFTERFCREARALARLSHPGIVSVYDFGEAGGYSYLLMEYVDGLTLRQLLQRGKLRPEEALALVPSICDALQFAHKQGVVHRDIKPENILLDKEGRVKIADFGIAKLVDPGSGQPALTGGKDVIGTPHYMAPEQVEHPAKVDHRADIFSLGVVIYEMLTGELPLGKFRPPSSKVTVDVRLDEIVLHALEKEPERRYQQVSQVKTDVENVSIASSRGSESQATPATQSGAPERKSAAIAVGAYAAATLGLLASATHLQPGFLLILTLIGAAGLLTAAILFARKAWAGPTPEGTGAASFQHPRVLPASLLLLCVLMLVQGFYALLETVLRQQPGVAIFPTSICLVMAVGLLFLKRWARILALAWVWVSYVLYLLFLLLMLRSRFPGSNVDLRTEIMGRGVEDPRYYVLAILLFVSAALMLPWTHWLLTRDHIKALFGVHKTSQGRRSQTWGFAIGVAVILAAVLTWLAMPKRLGTILSGRVTSAETGDPIQASITVTGSRSRVWRTTADREGAYSLQVPQDAGLLYRDDTGEHSTDVLIGVDAHGFESAHFNWAETRLLSYYKREGNFKLTPVRSGPGLGDKTEAEPKTAPAATRSLSYTWRKDDEAAVKPIDINLLQIRRVLTDAETNTNTAWLETSAPGEPRLPVDSFVAVNATHIERATLSDEVFSTPGRVDTRNRSVQIKMTASATPLFEEFTKTNIGRRLAVIINGRIVSAPVVQSAISSGLGQITGNSSFTELLDLTARLNRLTKPAEHMMMLSSSERAAGVLDLDTGRLIKWPKEMPDWNEAAIDRWLADVGADCAGVPDATGLGIWRMRMFHLPADALANMPARHELLVALAATNIVVSSRTGAPLEIGPEPAVYGFCTAAGSAGVMQVSARNDRIALHYKLLNPQEALSPVFSEIIEEVLNDEGTGRDFFLDFESGRTFTPPKGLDFNSPASVQWLRTNGVDAVGETSTSVRGLVGVEMTAFPVAKERWDIIRPEDLVSDPHLNISKAGSHTILSAKGALPETFIFRTREGTRGMLQITGFRQEPRGVKIRYKLVRRAGGSAQKENATPSSIGLNDAAGVDRNKLATSLHEGSEKIIDVDRSKFSQMYPAVWFSPATGELIPVDTRAERPPDAKYEIWIEPRDPEFRIGRNGTGSTDKEPGFALVGEGVKVFDETKSWDAKDLETGLANTFFCTVILSEVNQGI